MRRGTPTNPLTNEVSWFRAALDYMTRPMLVTALLASAAIAAFGCTEAERALPARLDSDKSVKASDIDRCASRREGCPCDDEGAEAACGSVKEQRGEYVICSLGVRICEDGEWSACHAKTEVERELSHRARLGNGLALQALGDQESCNDTCDPECTRLVDTPDDLTVPEDLTTTPDGLTLPGSGGGTCADLTVTPPSHTITVTQINASGQITAATPSVSVDFDGVCAGGAPVQPSWTLDSYDRAVINSEGTVTVFSGIAGPIGVTGATALDSDTATVNVVVAIGTLDAAGATAEPGRTLYPYKNTLFPLDLKAPLVQYQTGGTNATRVQVALRYPAGSASPTFRYVQTFGTSDPKQGTLNTNVPAWQVPQTVWEAFGRTVAANGGSGDIVIRRRNGATHYQEMTIPVKFAQSPLRGTVYYTQYLRRLATNSNNAVSTMCTDNPGAHARPQTGGTSSCNFNPGAYIPGQICPVGNRTHPDAVANTSMTRAIDLSLPTAPNQDPFGGTAGCPVCHSVSANGKVYVSGNQSWQAVSGANSRGINLIGTNASGLPTFTKYGNRDGKAPTYTGLADELYPQGPNWYCSNDGTSMVAGSAGDNYNNCERTDEWSRGLGYAALSPDGTYALQGSAFWGNTVEIPAANNTQDGTMKGLMNNPKPYFFLKSAEPGVGVQFATTGALPSNTWATNPARMTSTAAVALTVDGVTLNSLGQSVLVKNEGTASRNGVYVLTQVNPWQLRRRYDMDATAEAVSGTEVRVSDGNTNQGKVFYVSTAPATLNTNNLAFSERVMPAIAYASSPFVARVATTTSLAGYNWDTTNGGRMTKSSAGTLSIDGVAVANGDVVLVKDDSTPSRNGVYTQTASSPWQLTRHTNMNATAEVVPGIDVRVTNGSVNGGKGFYVSTPATAAGFTLNTNNINFSLNGLPSMMTPVFSPANPSNSSDTNLVRVAYVNADADIAGGLAATGWRRGLSMMTVDLSTHPPTVSNKKRLLNTWNSGAPGIPMKWPFFESDSRSLVYVETETTEYCSAADSLRTENWANTPVRKACYEAAYSSMSPTTRGYWKGTIHSIDTAAATPSTTKAALANLNRAEDTTSGAGANANAYWNDRSYQPSVLPFSAGGYRWVIFTSPRNYGNQLNSRFRSNGADSGNDTHFTCAAPMLWMAALENTTATATDRSHPAFLVPGQNLSNITSDHYINERGYLVPSPCKPVDASCTASDECCGYDDPLTPTACRAESGWTPDQGAPERSCQQLTGTCANEGESCDVDSDCCGENSTCVNFACVPPPAFEGATFQREYTGECPIGYHPDWQLFSFRLTTDSDSSLSFWVQAVQDLDDLETAPSIELGTSQADVAPPASPEFYDVGAALDAAGLAGQSVSRHMRYVRITIGFNPSADGMHAPVLHDWEMRYTCKPGE